MQNWLSLSFIFVLVPTLILSPVIAAESKLPVRQMFAQKIILDLRTFCPNLSPSKPCYKPLTHVSPELANFIAESNVGGVILFSENLPTLEQAIKLIYDLQKAAARSTSGIPLFITIDQEGGRVARLPRAESTSLSGNMALGSIYANDKKQGEKFARLSGEILGAELQASGFNLNFAPNVDVNINPDNPVINVRSFSDKPEVVATLAGLQLREMQKHQVIGALKHFPGHGDTSVDSHTGLPRVDHDLTTIQQVDLLPFKQLINTGDVDMVMTAHIQFPPLDDSTFVSKSGKVMIKPATMSSHILRRILRKQLGFEGVIVSDALDMKGISDFFTPTQAVVEAFKAGVDIALMPIKIQSTNDFSRFHHLLSALEQSVKSGELSEQEISKSYARVIKLKGRYRLFDNKLSIDDQLANATNTLASARHKWIERQIAEQSITVFRGSGHLPASIKTLHILMPDDNKCAAIISALDSQKPSLQVSCDSILTTNITLQKRKIEQSDAFLAANLYPKQSILEMGRRGQLSHFSKQQRAFSKQLGTYAEAEKHILTQLFSHASISQKPSYLVSLRMPSVNDEYGDYVEHIIFTYGYNQHQDKRGTVSGPSYHALAKLLVRHFNAHSKPAISMTHD